MELKQQTLDKIKQHAQECYPNECCGLIIHGDYVPYKNTAVNPTEAFRINAADYTAALLNGGVEALIHSHCYTLTEKLVYDPRWASGKDMEQWLATNIPWGIVAVNEESASEVLWYDDNEIHPLKGRVFVHGIRDCYGIIRDYYRTELNIELINVARGMGWWDNGQNLYEDNFARAGFYEITAEEADINDVCLFKVRSPVPNHAAVITGNNQILHHLFHRLSETDSLSRWRKHITKYIRYSDELNTLMRGKSNDSSNLSTR